MLGTAELNYARQQEGCLIYISMSPSLLSCKSIVL